MSEGADIQQHPDAGVAARPRRSWLRRLTRLVGTALLGLLLLVTIYVSAGRLLIRKSGTEPVVRVMGEGEDPDLLKQVVEELARCIEQASQPTTQALGS